MKKYLLTCIALATLWSCQKDEQYENLNNDPKNPKNVSAGFLFTAATVSLSDQMQSPNVNLNIFRFISQYLTATTYLDEPNYDLNTRNIADNHWSELYRDVIFDLKDAKTRVQNNALLTEDERKARIGQIEVVEIYAWQILVDTYGDIPYTEALNIMEFPLPGYDDDAAIYEDLISRLTAVRENFQAGEGFSASDMIYHGDMVKWEKFANSLLLRMGMRLADVNPGLSQTAVNAAITGGVFESNTDNAIVVYAPTFPNTNPLWEDLVQSGRSDYVLANTIVDYMVSLSDPRMTTYFDDNLSGGYSGGEYGASSAFSTHTHMGEAFYDPTIPGILLDYAEIQFYLAEAAQRGGYATTMTAEQHYDEAVTASILYWNGTTAEATTYLGQADVAYDGTPEQLATQFWIAMFNNPFQGWSVWRKFDAPTLNVAAESGLPVPLRYTYPISEQNLNPTNYNAASSAIGGDEQQTPVFWDVP